MLAEVVVNEGETVEVGALLGSIGEGDGRAVSAAAEAAAVPTPEAAIEAASKTETAPATEAAPMTAAPAGSKPVDTSALSPAARRVVEEHGLDPAQITGTGKDGRLTKEDALKAVCGGGARRKLLRPARSPAGRTRRARRAGK